MTTTPHARPAPPAPTLADRLAVGALLGVQDLSLRALALAGDPVARWSLGSPRTDVYALYERIRRRGPVVRSRTGVHALTSAELCEQVLRDPTFGVRPAGHADGAGDRTDPVARIALPPTVTGSFLEMDPPDHTRLRRTVAPAFRPRVVRERAPRLEALLHRLVDRVEDRVRRGEHFDVMADLAAPFPIAVISDLLGVPEADAARFRAIGNTVGQALDGVRTLRQVDRLRTAGLELEELFARLLDERAAEPRDDVLSVVAAARAVGTATGREALETAGLLLVAGFETTVNLIGNGIAALAAHPQWWERLVAEPDLAPRVVEETLRFDPSVQATSRIAHADTTLAGTALPAGSTVLVLTAAANRDPAAHPRPAVFDPLRTGEPDHLTFSSGIHFCLGTPLARLEGEIAFRVLAQRLPRLRLLPGARRRAGAVIRGYATLPATAR